MGEAGSCFTGLRYNRMNDDCWVIIEVGDDIIVVENLPAGVYTRCGEKEFSPEVVRRLEHVRHEQAAAYRELRAPVVEFEAVPA